MGSVLGGVVVGVGVLAETGFLDEPLDEGRLLAAHGQIAFAKLVAQLADGVGVGDLGGLHAGQ